MRVAITSDSFRDELGGVATAVAALARRDPQPLDGRDGHPGPVRNHQAADHRVILVSGTLAPLPAEIGRQLGIEETVGTPLVLWAGRYTGACELPVCQGEIMGEKCPFVVE